MLSLAPFSEVAIVAAYQHIGQIYSHYGPHNGDAVLRSFKTKVFLSGLDRRTTEFAARLAILNAIQHAPIDDRKKTKGERLAEAKRVYIYAEELRKPDRHKHAIALVGDAPPIKCSPAPLVRACPQELSHAANKGTPYVIDFQTAEAQYENIDPQKFTGVRKNPGQHAELFQPQTSPADEIDDKQARRHPGVPTADRDSLEA